MKIALFLAVCMLFMIATTTKGQTGTGIITPVNMMDNREMVAENQKPSPIYLD